MNDVDVLVVGAGALGLACAARLAEAGHGVLVAERERLVGSHTSSRNSEVIHAGLYYPPGSLKADLCLEGRERLYSWCARHGVGHRRIGKLLVAVEENEREAPGPGGQRPRLRGRRPDATGRRQTARAGAPSPRGRRPALAEHGNHRQPRLPAIAAGRRRAPRRTTGAGHPGRPPGAPRRRLARRRTERRRSVPVARGLGDQCRRPVRPGAGATHRRPRSAPGAGAAPVPGALFLLQRPLAVPPPGLPDARGAHHRARHPRHPRPRRPVALRSRRELRGQPRLPRRRIPRPRLRPGHLALLPRHRPSAPGRRLRRHPAQLGGPGNPPPTSSSKPLPNTACPAWSTCSASSRPASPPAWRSPNGSPEHSETRFRRAQGRPGKTALLYSPAHSPLPAQRIRP